jgi:heptosyltransferase I
MHQARLKIAVSACPVPTPRLQCAMRKILIIKTSSMGDVIHNLPVATDLAAHFPGAAIDWVVEENFADIPALHPAVRQTIPIALRRWRKTLFSRQTWAEISAFKQQLQSEQYDAVLDTQGLIKSALVSRWAHGTKYGYDKASAREHLAALAYEKQFSVNNQIHAVDRNRLLAAAAFAYPIDSAVNYGIAAEPLQADWLPTAQYAVLLHATSRDDKQWDENHWIVLGKKLRGLGTTSVLPWGNAAEKARSERLAQTIEGAIVPPGLNLTMAASLLAGAQAIIGVDTGLTHLAAALNKPVVAIYSASSPGLTGVHGNPRALNLGDHGHPPTLDAVWQALRPYIPS